MDNLQYYRKLQKEEIVRERCEAIIDMFLDQRMTIRLCAENLCIPKSSIHHYIHTKIRYEYPDEYQIIKNKLRWNQKNLCVNRKYWR